MNEDLGFLLFGVLVVGLLVSLRLLAKKFKFFRWYWNTSFKISSYMPFCGWMARFIIAENEEEEKMKEFFVQTGDNTDDVAVGVLDNAVQREKERIKEAQELQSAICQKLGRGDVTVSSDGKSVKIGDGNWMPAEDAKRQLNM